MSFIRVACNEQNVNDKSIHMLIMEYQQLKFTTGIDVFMNKFISKYSFCPIFHLDHFGLSTIHYIYLSF